MVSQSFHTHRDTLSFLSPERELFQKEFWGEKTDLVGISAISRTRNIHYLFSSFQISYIFHWGNRYLLSLKPLFNVAKIKPQQFLVQRLVLQLPKIRGSVHY